MNPIWLSNPGYVGRRGAPRRYLIAAVVLLGMAMLLPPQSMAQWAANPGDTVRNAFGPVKNLRASVCRGACGLDCPSSCDQQVQFECVGNSKLLRVRTYSCGTHQGCREHDDCLDICSQEHGAGYDCAAECHAEAVTNWGLERAGLWAAGEGPVDADPIMFQYTMDVPDSPEAFYRCPDGARQQCTAGRATCLSGDEAVEPVFNTFAGGSGGTVRVSGFRSGRVCTAGGQPSSVCQDAVDIQIIGDDHCAQPGGTGRCTWYGFELYYHNANPAEPLICRSSATEEDFLGGIVTRAIEAAHTDPETDSELGKMLGHFQRELNSGKSLDQLFSGITVTTADGKTLGEPAPAEAFQEPGVPGEVLLEGASGHLLVPIFEWHAASPPGTSVEHNVRCSQQGRPVIETQFRLHFAAQGS